MKAATAGLLAVAIFWPHAATAQPRPAAPAAAPSDLILPFQYVGVAGCGRRGCHNDGQAVAQMRKLGRWVRGAETSLWLLHDRHAEAHNVLLNEESKAIAKNLGLRQPADKADVCLDCHALNPPVNQRGSKYSLTMGVSCESCHGPAERWLAIHTRWRAWNAQQKQQIGFRNLRSIETRVKLCAHCHVGDSKRNVNHDLLAAGHPPLEFEAASFHDRQRKHWDFPAEKARDPMIQPRLWLVGQAAAGQALATVVAHEAQQGLWPEFAYYDCASCHHALTGAVSTASSGKVGQAQWGRWQAVFVGLASKRFPALPQGVADPLAGIQDAMKFYDDDRDDAARHAGSLARGFGAWGQTLNQARLTAEDARALARAVLEIGGGNPDPATQRERFLALRALTDFEGARLRNAAFDKLVAEFDKPVVNPRPLDSREAAVALDVIRERLAQ